MTRGTFRSARSFISNFREIVLPAAIVLLCSQTVAVVFSAAQLFEKGAEALRRGDYPLAEDSFLRILELEPKNVGALGNLGVVYAKTNRRPKAIQTYNRALRITPSDQGLLLNLGIAYLKEEDYADALGPLLKANAADPDNLQVRELVATCRIYSGDLSTAISSLEELRIVDPNKAGVLYLLGVAYTRAKQPDKAKPVFAELLASAVDPLQSSFVLGRIYYDGGRFADAEQSLLDVVGKEPGFPGAQLALAKVYISERENEKAVQELQRLLQRDSRNADAHYVLGALRVQTGNYAGGIPELEIAKKDFPNSWATSFYLGKAMLRTGRTEEAISLLKRAAELNPDEQSVYYLLGQAYRSTGRMQESKTTLQMVKQLDAGKLRKEEAAVGHIPDPD